MKRLLLLITICISLFSFGQVIEKFTCNSCEYNSFYQVHSNTLTVGSNISSLNILTSALEDLQFSPSNLNINAVGMNINDSIAYGIRWGTNQLIRIEKNGFTTNLGPVAGLPISSYDSGDFGPDGFLHIRQDQGQTVYRINVNTISVIGTYNFSALIEPGDFALNTVDNLFYSILNSGQLISIEPLTGIVSFLSTTNVTGNIGAMYSDNLGRIWALQNSTGNLYEIIISTGIEYLVSVMNPSSFNDGFSCRKIVNSNPLTQIIHSECDSYTWSTNGQTYNQSGQFTEVLTNQNGCDSTITLNLTITNSNTGSETVTECDSYTWSTNGQTYTQSGQYTEVLTNQDGCDSTVTLNLTITNSNTGSETVTECDSYTWSTNGQTYTQSGQYTSVLTNQSGCDSTVTLNLTITNSSSSSITETVCDTYTAPDGQTYTSTGNYTAVIPNAEGCDSTITIDLTITNSSSSSITETVCDTYTAPDGQTYTSTGNYTAVIPNAEGCDSTITIDLTVNALTTLNGGVDVTLCEGDSVILSGSGAQSYAWTNGVIDGAYFTPTVGTTTYTVTGTDLNGCENTDDVQVTVSETPVLIITGFSPDCQGESTGSAQADVTGGISPYNFVWSNGSITSVIGGIPAGTYSVTVSDNVGCVTSGEVIVTDGTDPCFFIPGGLSPNGDGNNDTWGVTGLDNYPEAKVMVYNRWGQLLYDAGPNDDPWDGTYLGEELPTADYYYIIDLGNGETFNGVITLKR